MRRNLTVKAAVPIIGSILFVGCGGGNAQTSTTTATQAVKSRPLPPNAIRVEWKPRALRPAVHRGRVCVTTVKTGHFCATYTAGQVPATQLRIKLLERGFIPVTVK